MGGDHVVCRVVVEGLKQALSTISAFTEALLVGNQSTSRRKLSRVPACATRAFKSSMATEVLTMDDKPLEGIRKKKDSSMVRAIELVRERQGRRGHLPRQHRRFGAADETGDLMAVERPAIACGCLHARAICAVDGPSPLPSRCTWRSSPSWNLSARDQSAVCLGDDRVCLAVTDKFDGAHHRESFFLRMPSRGLSSIVRTSVAMDDLNARVRQAGTGKFRLDVRLITDQQRLRDAEIPWRAPVSVFDDDRTPVVATHDIHCESHKKETRKVTFRVLENGN